MAGSGDNAADLKALHANIFGEDDSDDEEADADLAADATDERVQRILSSAPRGGGGKGKKGSEGRRLSKSKDGEPKQKRLKKGNKERGSSGAVASSSQDADGSDAPARGDGEAEGEDGGGEEEGEEEDSDGAPEAVEEGGAGDLDRILQGLKGRRGGIQRSREAILAEVKDLQAQMEAAAERDDEDCKAEPPRPAVHKVAMLGEVVTLLQKRHLHETMIDHGMLTTLAMWLKPMPDGSLVNLQVRSSILQSLMLFEVDETVLGSLRSSGIGKYVKLLSLHSKETQENKRRAVALMEKWKRPIFQSSVLYNAADVQVVVPKHSPAELTSEAHTSSLDEFSPRDPPGMTRKTGGGARVPRPVGMDFSKQPASSAQPLPSTKYQKDSTKGRLQERLLGKGRKSVSTQAVKLSVEGRTMDRF